jgi:hypothetical protein
MATAVTMYRANDGTKFDSRERAELHDTACDLIKHAMSGLAPRTPELEANKGYLQQRPDRLQSIYRALMRIAAVNGAEWWIKDQRDKGHSDEKIAAALPYMWSRIGGDSCKPLDQAYGRLNAIDEQGREYQQPCYVLSTMYDKDKPTNCLNA